MSKNKLIVKNTIFLATRTLFSLLIAFTRPESFYTNLVYRIMDFLASFMALLLFCFYCICNERLSARFISINLGNNDYIAVSNTIKNSVLIYFLGGMIFCLLLLLIRDYVVEHLLTIDVNALAVAKKYM